MFYRDIFQSYDEKIVKLLKDRTAAKDYGQIVLEMLPADTEVTKDKRELRRITCFCDST